VCTQQRSSALLNCSCSASLVVISRGKNLPCQAERHKVFLWQTICFLQKSIAASWRNACGIFPTPENSLRFSRIDLRTSLVSMRGHGYQTFSMQAELYERYLVRMLIDIKLNEDRTQLLGHANPRWVVYEIKAINKLPGGTFQITPRSESERKLTPEQWQKV